MLSQSAQTCRSAHISCAVRKTVWQRCYNKTLMLPLLITRPVTQHQWVIQRFYLGDGFLAPTAKQGHTLNKSSSPAANVPLEPMALCTVGKYPLLRGLRHYDVFHISLCWTLELDVALYDSRWYNHHGHSRLDSVV